MAQEDLTIPVIQPAGFAAKYYGAIKDVEDFFSKPFQKAARTITQAGESATMPQPYQLKDSPYQYKQAQDNAFLGAYSKKMAPEPTSIIPFTQKGQEMASSIFQETKPDYLSSLFNFEPAPSTEDYKMPKTTELIPRQASSTAMQGSILKPAQNQAQAGQAGSNYIQDAHNAVMDLMKGGKAIPREQEGALNLQQYNRVERDASGNIIGLSGRMQVDPISGASIGKIAPDYQAKIGGLGTPYTPNLDAFKARQAVNPNQPTAKIQQAIQASPKISEAYKQSKKQGEMIA